MLTKTKIFVFRKIIIFFIYFQSSFRRLLLLLIIGFSEAFKLPNAKIFNWLSTYLGNPPLLHLKTTSGFFGLLFLLMFTIGGSTGIILGNAAVDLGLHDTYYVVAHFHFVLSLGAVIAIFSGIIFIGEKIVGSKILLPSSSSTLSLYHLVSTFIGILLTFSPMHFLGFNVMPRRIPDFPDSFHSWNFLSSIGSGITFLSFAIFFLENKSINDSKCREKDSCDPRDKPQLSETSSVSADSVLMRSLVSIFNPSVDQQNSLDTFPLEIAIMDCVQKKSDRNKRRDQKE